MKKYFGYEQFRPLQAEIITAALQQRDVLVLMPTGGGKSLCFQIPALISEGLAVVVSPLIALMKDQVEGLIANGVGAAFLNSTQQLDEQQNIEQRILEGDIKLLYVSPEKLLTEAFLVWLTKIKISFFAIDEAHCISAWGHDFRPEYTQLRLLKERFADTPLMALTATADRLTRTDIMAQLCMQEPAVFIASFDRPNLSLTVLPAQNRMAMLLSFWEKGINKTALSIASTANAPKTLPKNCAKTVIALLTTTQVCPQMSAIGYRKILSTTIFPLFAPPLLLVWASTNPMCVLWRIIICPRIWKAIIRK